MRSCRGRNQDQMSELPAAEQAELASTPVTILQLAELSVSDIDNIYLLYYVLENNVPFSHLVKMAYQLSLCLDAGSWR